MSTSPKDAPGPYHTSLPLKDQIQVNAYLSYAFRRLNSLLDDSIEVDTVNWADDLDICLRVGQTVYYRGEGTTEWADVTFTWAEWMDPNVNLNLLTKQRWEEARQAQAAEAARLEEKRKQEEAVKEAAAKEERKKGKAARELAEYQRLKSIYGPKN